ncbi:hypothetical protein SDC9_168433 [bioreactor metagenome]|uniref:Uncharacterized protein n=1 Tax=bioreactor metagenome TaxID=1076179 RepID=A0A645GAF8_9ZZZZ
MEHRPIVEGIKSDFQPRIGAQRQEITRRAERRFEFIEFAGEDDGPGRSDEFVGRNGNAFFTIAPEAVRGEFSVQFNGFASDRDGLRTVEFDIQRFRRLHHGRQDGSGQKREQKGMKFHENSLRRLELIFDFPQIRRAAAGKVAFGIGV